VIPFRRVFVFPLHPCLGTPAAESTTEKAEMKHWSYPVSVDGVGLRYKVSCR